MGESCTIGAAGRLYKPVASLGREVARIRARGIDCDTIQGKDLKWQHLPGIVVAQRK